uniref:Uncharacterized protein n=1 Tax=Parascaris univalens TaxID=6257 RepID=A0A915AII5_PARUN
MKLIDNLAKNIKYFKTTMGNKQFSLLIKVNAYKKQAGEHMTKGNILKHNTVDNAFGDANSDFLHPVRAWDDCTYGDLCGYTRHGIHLC